MIRLRRIDHACLRVEHLDEAAARWAIQFGLTEKRRDETTAYLACGYEDYSLELVVGAQPGQDHTGFELARDVSLEDAAAHLDASGVPYRRDEHGHLHVTDPTGYGIELMPWTERNPFPDVGRQTATLPVGRPRKLGHVNVLAPDVAAMRTFYTEVLGMYVTDWLGNEGLWLHVNADHHVMAVVGKSPAHFHHIAFDIVDWGQLRAALDHVGQHGRWLGWGPVRHTLGQNLCAYVRIPEESLFVELYCDMEVLALPHEARQWADDPRGSNLWGILPPRSYFRFDPAAVESERLQLEALGTPLAPL